MGSGCTAFLYSAPAMFKQGALFQAYYRGLKYLYLVLVKKITLDKRNSFEKDLFITCEAYVFSYRIRQPEEIVRTSGTDT
jgi:hypothetical protein